MGRGLAPVSIGNCLTPIFTAVYHGGSHFRFGEAAVFRIIVVKAALAMAVMASSRISHGQEQEAAQPPPNAVLQAPIEESQPTLGARRFGPIYEPGRLPPATDENGWPADWDERPHLSVDIFGATSEFSATREFDRRPYGAGQHFGRGPYGQRGYGHGPYAGRGFGRGSENRDLFSSDSAFVLRYGYPGERSAFETYPPWLGAPGFGPAYGPYSPWYGYTPYGGYPSYFGYGPGSWAGATPVPPPAGYGGYFGW
jgi:hypothetical protein